MLQDASHFGSAGIKGARANGLQHSGDVGLENEVASIGHEDVNRRPATIVLRPSDRPTREGKQGNKNRAFRSHQPDQYGLEIQANHGGCHKVFQWSPGSGFLIGPRTRTLGADRAGDPG